jgi:hypothetical protein
MTFTYLDLMYFLEETHVLPEAYFEIEDGDPAHEFLAKWLGYENLIDYYCFELDVDNHRDQGTGEGYSSTSVQNEPPTLAKDLYIRFINSCVDHAQF